jgi:hypothetical protein
VPVVVAAFLRPIPSFAARRCRSHRCACALASEHPPPPGLRAGRRVSARPPRARTAMPLANADAVRVPVPSVRACVREQREERAGGRGGERPVGRVRALLHSTSYRPVSRPRRRGVTATSGGERSPSARPRSPVSQHSAVALHSTPLRRQRQDHRITRVRRQLLRCTAGRICRDGTCWSVVRGRSGGG